jgi:hypothetical protein
LKTVAGDVVIKKYGRFGSQSTGSTSERFIKAAAAFIDVLGNFGKQGSEGAY